MITNVTEEEWGSSKDPSVKTKDETLRNYAKRGLSKKLAQTKHLFIDGIMKIYASSKKQIFIAFDKQDAYAAETRKIVSDNQVLKLSNNHCELYGQSWNVEEAQHEDEL